MSPSWMASAVREWLGSYPAVRMQHRHDYPVGKGLEAWQDDSGATWLRSLIVDDAAKKMVKSGVLAAYSVGIAGAQQRKSGRCPRFEIYGGRLAEVSVVDSPSNARCGITVTKGDKYVGKAWNMTGDRAAAKAEKHLRKAAELLGVDAVDLDAGLVQKAMSAHMRAALESSNPWIREMAREAFRGED